MGTFHVNGQLYIIHKLWALLSFFRKQQRQQARIISTRLHNGFANRTIRVVYSGRAHCYSGRAQKSTKSDAVLTGPVSPEMKPIICHQRTLFPTMLTEGIKERQKRATTTRNILKVKPSTRT